MAKAPVYGPNGGFVMHDKPSGSQARCPTDWPSSRWARILESKFLVQIRDRRSIARIHGPAHRDYGEEVYVRGAQLYAEGGRSVPITVEGAKLQHGTGHSYSSKGADGRSYYFGIEAAHFGIGTVTRCGEALGSAHRFKSTSGGRPQGSPPMTLTHSRRTANSLATVWPTTLRRTTHPPSSINQKENWRRSCNPK